MENSDLSQPGFEFLTNIDVQKHFADLNIELLRGKHIMPSSPGLFAILDAFGDKFERYYESLYGLELKKRTHDNVSYFYLDFPAIGKGKLNNSSLYAEMDGKTTVVACILANLYFTNYFSYDKKFEWSDIQYEIEHGEHREAYQRLFFNNVRADFTDDEWSSVRKQFGTVINFFHRINLVEREDSDDLLQFTILPTIHHFIELYKKEIEDINGFLAELKL